MSGSTYQSKKYGKEDEEWGGPPTRPTDAKTTGEEEGEWGDPPTEAKTTREEEGVHLHPSLGLGGGGRYTDVWSWHKTEQRDSMAKLSSCWAHSGQPV